MVRLRSGLPQNTRIHRSLLLGRNSHRIRRIHRSLLLGRNSHRIRRIHRSLLLKRNSHRELSGGALVSSAPTRSVVALLALLMYFLLCWCTSCSVVALETSEPPERTYLCRSVKSVGEYTARRFCVFREFRGRIYCKKVLCIP